MQSALEHAPAAFEQMEKFMRENDSDGEAAAKAISNLYKEEGGKALTQDDLNALADITTGDNSQAK
jgi:hypothetical protein